MECLSATQFGRHSKVLDFDSIDELPECGPNDVLIKVVYAELNPVDLQKLRGGSREGQATPGGRPLVVGYGGSGIVQDTGSNVPRDWRSKRVAFLCDPTRPGAYATHVLVDSRAVAPVPFQVSLKEAATVPLSGCTAYEALLKLGLGNLAPLRGNDPTLLVVGGGGGVGSWAIQLARVLYPDLNIVSTASSAESNQFCRRMGANRIIHHSEIAIELQGGRAGSVDYILCLTEPTPELFRALTDVIRPFGYMCLVVAGDSIKSLDLSFAFFKGVTVAMETVFSSFRTNFDIVQPASEIEDLLEHVGSDASINAPLSPQLDGLTGADDWRQALSEGGILDMLANGHTTGKLVMRVGTED